MLSHGILPSNKKKEIIDTCNNLDGWISKELQYTKCKKKPISEGLPEKVLGIYVLVGNNIFFGLSYVCYVEISKLQAY